MPVIDLLIIADRRADLFNVVRRIREHSPGVEVRLDGRRGERRQSGEVAAGEERRRRERRTRDVSEALRTIGWAFIPAMERQR